MEFELFRLKDAVLDFSCLHGTSSQAFWFLECPVVSFTENQPFVLQSCAETSHCQSVVCWGNFGNKKSQSCWQYSASSLQTWMKISARALTGNSPHNALGIFSCPECTGHSETHPLINLNYFVCSQCSAEFVGRIHCNSRYWHVPYFKMEKTWPTACLKCQRYLHLKTVSCSPLIAGLLIINKFQDIQHPTDWQCTGFWAL